MIVEWIGNVAIVFFGIAFCRGVWRQGIWLIGFGAISFGLMVIGVMSTDP